MADSEEECDSWRNRDKYPKEREASEKKASPSPVETKTEKRPFNNYQSPTKSVEPPFKKQKSNFGDDSGYNNSGSFNNRRDGFDNRRDNFDNKKDNFDNRKDNFDNRKDNFDNRKDNFDNRKDNYDNRKDSFDNRKDSFDNRKDNFDNRKDSFDNRKDSFDNRKDNFDNRKNNFDNRSNNFDNRKNNFDNRSDNFVNRRDNFVSREDNFNNRKENNRSDNFESRNDGFENKRDNFDSRIPSGVTNRQNEEIPNYPTQPQMLLFKHFLQQQDDDIEMEVAMSKYNEYKENFVKKQLKAFFDSHSSQEWFREKYLPIFLEANKLKENKNILSRKEIFTYLLEHEWMDKIKLHVDESDSIVRLMDAIVILLEGGNENDLKILDSRRYRSESPNDTFEKITHVEKKLEEPVAISDDNNDETKESTTNDLTSDVILSNENVEANEIKETDEPRALHKTFSIFLRNLHPNVLRSEIEALVKPYDGFLRLALQDPTPDRKFFRRGWVTYDRTVNIKEICWNLNNIRLHDCDIGAIVNRELTQRVRSANVLTNHKPVMRHDIKLAAKLVAKFDKRHNLWPLVEGVACGNPMGSGNPLLKDITEYLVEEGSYEEEALLGGNLNCSLELASIGTDPNNITIENDEKLAQVLDKLILYLRFVHSYDYYSNTEYQNEDEMPHRCGIMHSRGVSIASDKPISLKDVEDYIKVAESKADSVLNAADKLPIEEAKKLGYKDIEEVTEAFIAANSQELGKDKWLCPLSGKKFKGPDFVRKHILNKHMDKVDEATLAAQFFDNYLLDVKRPQLPEHPTNRPGAKMDGDAGAPILISDGKQGDYGRGNDGYNNNRGMGRRNDDFDRRGGFRASSPSSGNNGSYYRKNTFSGRGGGMGGGRPQGGRQSNGGGSYYSRNMTSYKDLDAPMDD